MTIIAGFKCKNGIVVCADTLETSGPSKRQVPKLHFEETEIMPGEPIALAFCGAGYGPLIDKLFDESWKSAQRAATIDDVCGEIESTIKVLYKEYGEIYQAGACPTAELIYGVKTKDGNTKLFSANGPIVTERADYYSAGAGYYMADFLASRMYEKNLTLRQCVILAAYVLFQAKEHVDGCGGGSHIAALRNDGTSGLIDSTHVETLTNLVRDADVQVGRILMKCADRQLSEKEFIESSTSTLKLLAFFRELELKKLREHEEMWPTPGLDDTDDLGLPKLPNGKPEA